MGTPYFQQQSAAYNLCQRQSLHIFTPDGQRYLVSAGGKSYLDYATEVQDYLMQFEVESLLAQRDSLRDALTRRYLMQRFGAAGDARFAGADLDSVVAELKRRGLAPTPIKSALRTSLSRANSEIKDVWPIRESGRNLQYTSYDMVFAAEELRTPAKRQKIWDTVAAWAGVSKLPGKEGARLATLQEWDDIGDGYSIRVDLHHYPRPDPDSCSAIALLDATERNKDIDMLRKSLAKIGVELAELAVKPYALPQNTPLHEAIPSSPKPPPVVAIAIADTLAAVRIERDRLEQQLRLLSEALTDSEERQRQAHRIESLEQEKSGLEALLSGMTHTLDDAAWSDRPADWYQTSPAEKTLRIVETFELRQAALNASHVQLTATRDKLADAAAKLHQAEDELEATRQALAEAHRAHGTISGELGELKQRYAEAGAMQEKTLQELKTSRQSLAATVQEFEQTQAHLEEKKKTLDQNEKSLLIAQSELHMLTARSQTAEKDRDKLAAELRQIRKSRDEWQSRAENFESSLKAELLKQHNAALLAQELDFTRQIQDIQQVHMNLAQEAQQEHMREIQQAQDERLRQIEDIQQEHIRQIQELQATHLKQIQKLRRLSPAQETEEGWTVPQPGMYVPRSFTPAKPASPKPENLPQPTLRPEIKTVVSELGLYQAESQDVFDSRIGEYLRIAKDLGLSEADKWLLAEAKKLAEVRAKQGELGI
jgi:hypothetical protein